MTPFSRYIFVKTDMSGVEQADLSNREYSPDSYLCYRGVQEWRTAERVRQEVPQFQF